MCAGRDRATQIPGCERSAAASPRRRIKLRPNISSGKVEERSVCQCPRDVVVVGASRSRCVVEVRAIAMPIRRRARCTPDPSPRLRWVVISERGQCNLERTALQRTSRGSEPGGGGVSFTDTPQPPPPPGSDPGPLVGRPRNGKRML